MTVNQISPFIVYPITTGLLFYFEPNLNVYSGFLALFGYFMWNIMEYSFHRFIFHNRELPRKAKRYLSHGHMVHHRRPSDDSDVILPINLTYPISLILTLGTFIAFGASNLGWFYSGLILGLLNYELMHYAIHHSASTFAPFAYMKEHHMYHHTTAPQMNFMVSNPALDFLLGTKVKH